MSDTDDIKGEANEPTPFFRAPSPYRLQTLKTRPLFQQASGGPRFSTSAFTMLRRLPRVDEADAMSGIRFGFTVTKKVGHAVERNRIRRRLREAVRAAAPHFPPGAFDFVFLARKEALGIDFAALVQDVARAVQVLAKRDRPPTRK